MQRQSVKWLGYARRQGGEVQSAYPNVQLFVCVHYIRHEPDFRPFCSLFEHPPTSHQPRIRHGTDFRPFSILYPPPHTDPCIMQNRFTAFLITIEHPPPSIQTRIRNKTDVQLFSSLLTPPPLNPMSGIGQTFSSMLNIPLYPTTPHTFTPTPPLTSTPPITLTPHTPLFLQLPHPRLPPPPNP